MCHRKAWKTRGVVNADLDQMYSAVPLLVVWVEAAGEPEQTTACQGSFLVRWVCPEAEGFEVVEESDAEVRCLDDMMPNLTFDFLGWSGPSLRLKAPASDFGQSSLEDAWCGSRTQDQVWTVDCEVDLQLRRATVLGIVK